MAAERLGHEFKLFVDDGAGVLNEIQGQTGLTRDSSTALINQSHKGTGKFDLQKPGRSAITFTCTGKVVLPDANGLERVHALDAADPVVSERFEIREEPFAAGDIMFAAEMFVSNFSMDHPDQDNATFSFQLTLAAAPSVDDLSP